RIFTVKRDMSLTPKEDVTGTWEAVTPQSIASFSATAYFFGRSLYQNLKVPIGLIHSSWGGTVAEAWTSGSALRPLGDFDTALDKMDSLQRSSQEDQKATNKNSPTVLYNAMIAPLIPFAIKGAIWY